VAGTLLALLLAIAPHAREGDAQAVTMLVDARSGAKIADGRYAQRVENGMLHIESRNDFPDGRVIVERAVLRLRPQFTQESWEWTERKHGALVRQYQVDFRTKSAVAKRLDQHKLWKEDHLDIEPGKTFAGIAFVTLIKSLRETLAPGQKVELKAVAFTPRPRIATVSVSRGPPETVQMAGRSIAADRYTIHAEIPWFVRPFITAPDQRVWLYATGPASFLRYEGPLIEPKDPIVRVDTIPSGIANAGRARRRQR
jgi:hypothetical protein